MHTQWSRSTRYYVLSIILAGTAWLLFTFRELIGPLVISALLAYILNPLVGLMTRRTRLRRNLAVLIVYFFFLAVLITIPSIITPVVVRQIARLSVDLQSIQFRAEELFSSPIVIGNTILLLEQLLPDVEQLFQDIVGAIPGGALGVLTGITTNIIWVLVTLVTTYYLLQDGPRVRDWLIKLAPSAYRVDATRMMDDFDRVWSAFLRGQLILMSIIGVLTGIGVALVGLRGALIFGFLAGVLDVIPSLGPLLAGLIGTLVASFLGSSYLPISNGLFGLLVLGIFLLIQQIENIWFRPRIMGHTLRLHPGLVFVGVIGALALVGVLGALVIIPVMASIKIIGQYTHAKLFGVNPWESPGSQEEKTPSK